MAQGSIYLSWLQFVAGLGITVGSFALTDFGLSPWFLTTTFSHGYLDDDHFTAYFFGLILLPFGIIFTLTGFSRILTYPGYESNLLCNIVLVFLFMIPCIALTVYLFHKWGGTVYTTWNINATTINAAESLQSLFILLLGFSFSLLLLIISFKLIQYYQFKNKQNKNKIHNNYKTKYSDRTLSTSLLTEQSKTQSNIINETKSRPTQVIPMQIVNGDTSINNNTNDILDKLDLGSYEINDNNYNNNSWLYELLYGKFVKIWFLGIIMPILFIINGYMVSDWHKFTPAFIIKYIKIESPSEWTTNIAYKGIDNVTYYFKWYWSIFWVYGFIVITCIISYCARKNPRFRRTLATRYNLTRDVYLIGQSVTLGEIVVSCLFLIVFAIHFYYWGIVHIYEDDDTIVGIQHWARAFGLYALFFIMFMLFSVTRITLWIECFGLSFEHLIAIHRIFGTLVLICAYTHFALFLSFFAGNCDGDCTWIKMAPFAPNPPEWHEDNHTVFVMYYLVIFIFPIGYGLTYYKFRRNYFELFYYTHLIISFIFFSSVLWHASQGWRYIIPPLILYFLDRCLRFYNSCQICKINILNSINNETTLLSFIVHNGSNININIKTGQYCFINIPMISLFEWHPFTISSAQDSKYITMHIKKYGNNNSNQNKQQWTEKLHKFASKYNDSILNLPSLEIHVDGPYGKSLDFEGYNNVILVGGGIGVTPCHSIFATYLNKFFKKEEITSNMDLVWIVRKPHVFEMFNYTWKKYEEYKNNAPLIDRFNIHLYATRTNSKLTEDERIVNGTEGIIWKNKRPNIEDEFQQFFESSYDRESTLIFVCGPDVLVKSCEQTALNAGCHFLSESFEF